MYCCLNDNILDRLSASEAERRTTERSTTDSQLTWTYEGASIVEAIDVGLLAAAHEPSGLDYSKVYPGSDITVAQASSSSGADSVIIFGAHDGGNNKLLLAIDTGWCNNSAKCVYESSGSSGWTTPPALFWYYDLARNSLSNMAGQAVISGGIMYGGSLLTPYVTFTDADTGTYFLTQ